MLVVDIYGSPNSGKSTCAAYVFSKLKMLGIKCELVTEVAKDIVWDGSLKMLSNQAYVFGNQFYRLSRLEGSVDVAVTDSPLLLSTIYNSNSKLGSWFTGMVLEVAKSYDTLSYFLPVFDAKHYDDIGRVHHLDESKMLSAKIEDMLHMDTINYKTLDHNEESYNCIISDVLKRQRLLNDIL